MRRCLLACVLTGGALVWSAAAASLGQEVSFPQQANPLAVYIDGRPVAAYVWSDPRIARPYWAHVHAPNGVQVTRNHPPVAGKDATDHDTFHPGIWMAFGDLSGADFWRNQAPVVHARDYGLLVANPFGRQAFGQGEKSQVAVEPGRTFRLRFGVLIHADEGPERLRAAYADDGCGKISWQRCHQPVGPASRRSARW